MYYVKCLFGFCLVPESDYSSEDVSNESSDNKEDKESEKNWYIIVPYGHIIVPSCVTLQLCSLLVFRNLTSISACFFCPSASYSFFLICLYYLQAYSWFWVSSSPSWVLLIASLGRSKSSNPCLASFIVQKASEVCGCLFFRLRLKS